MLVHVLADTPLTAAGAYVSEFIDLCQHHRRTVIRQPAPNDLVQAQSLRLSGTGGDGDRAMVLDGLFRHDGIVARGPNSPLKL
jgi:hypothetical protein